MTIELTISEELERRCKDWCKRWFPKEAYGLLLGTLAGDSVHVDDIWTPSEASARKNFRRRSVFFDPEWVHELKDFAQEEELMIVGDFHSHPYRNVELSVEPIQSSYDIDMGGKHAVFGVVNVVETATGRLSTRLRWWGLSLKVKVRREYEVQGDSSVRRTGRRRVGSRGVDSRRSGELEG